jgi:hypothetical protein
MSNLADLVPLPPIMNSGLSACREDTMLHKFGKPGELTATCSPPSGAITARIKRSVDVGPFAVSGLDYAVESLSQIFEELRNAHADVFSEIKSAGMLCVRRIKFNPSHYSNHSWGTAIDLYFGSGVAPQGMRATQRGFLYFRDIFNKHGWYWGAGFSGGSVDSMHFELADETVRALPDTSLSQDMLIAATDYIEAMRYESTADA